MIKTPRPYQREAADRFKDSDSIYLAMDMRLGKSLTLLLWLLEKKEAPVAFIVAPKTVLVSWREELTEEQLPFWDLTDFATADRPNIINLFREHGPVFFLINYEGFKSLEGDVDWETVDCLALDEATRIKNNGSETTRSMIRVCDSVKYKACLSGTPAPENWFELFAQLAFLGDGYFMGVSNFYRWRKRVAACYGVEWVIRPKQLALIKKKFHEMAFCLTRKQAGIGEEKIYQKRSGQLPPRAAKIAAHIMKKWEIPGHEIDEPTDSTKYAITVCLWLRKLCGGFLPSEELPSWKYDCLLDDLASTDGQVVVWFAFNAEIERAEKLLKAHKVRCSSLTGKTKDRAGFISGFRKGKFRVALVQLKLGQYGIRLDTADTAIYFSNNYSNEQRRQSEDRIVKVGKESPLLYIDYVTESSVEEDIQEALKDKQLGARFLLARVQDRREMGVL